MHTKRKRGQFTSSTLSQVSANTYAPYSSKKPTPSDVSINFNSWCSNEILPISGEQESKANASSYMSVYLFPSP